MIIESMSMDDIYLKVDKVKEKETSLTVPGCNEWVDRPQQIILLWNREFINAWNT